MDKTTIPVDPVIQSEMDSIAIRRGNILANFAFIEGLMSDFVIRHYLKDEKLVKTMREDIFEDEFFGYMLKFNLFKKVLRKYYPNEAKKFPIEKFRELSKLRNIIAHASVEIMINEQIKKAMTSILFSHNGEYTDAQEIMDKYDKLKDELQPSLQDLASNLKLFQTTINNDFTK